MRTSRFHREVGSSAVKVVVGLTLLGAVLAALSWKLDLRPAETEDIGIPIPEVSSSPFLNTKPEAKYVGSQKCAGRCLRRDDEPSTRPARVHRISFFYSVAAWRLRHCNILLTNKLRNILTKQTLRVF